MAGPFQFEVFFGEASDAAARVYARVMPSDGDKSEWRLSGRVEGPMCRYSHTLPATIPLAFRDTKALALYAEAIVPDPCFWTPDLPFLYRVVVEVRRENEVIATYEQPLGIRPLGVIRRRFVFRGKTWVPRIVNRDSVLDDPPLDAWREASAVMAVNEPDDALCAEAGRTGVVLAAMLDGDDPSIPKRAGALSRFPAVAVIITNGRTGPFTALHAFVRNVLLGRFIQLPNDEAADVLLANFDENGGGLPLGAIKATMPIIAVRPLAERRSLADARSACDDLQRQLAGKCEIAGYMV